jgi:DNA-binding transcriptional regulator LsrR (DeoR family)
MRKVREVLRQRYACGASERVIAQSLGLGRTAVGEYIRRAAVIGITWPVPAEFDDAALERRLTRRVRSRCRTGPMSMPSCAVPA